MKEIHKNNIHESIIVPKLHKTLNSLLVNISFCLQTMVAHFYEFDTSGDIWRADKREEKI